MAGEFEDCIYYTVYMHLWICMCICFSITMKNTEHLENSLEHSEGIFEITVVLYLMTINITI